MLTTRDGPAVIDVKARYWSNIAIFAPVWGSLSEYSHKVSYIRKLELCDYPTVKKV